MRVLTVTGIFAVAVSLGASAPLAAQAHPAPGDVSCGANRYIEYVDVVLNSLAGDHIEKGLEALGAFGRFLELGAADIFANHKLGMLPFSKSLTFTAVMIGPGMPGFADSWRALMAHFAAGDYQPLPHVAYDAQDAVAAFEFMAAAKHIGKVVVRR